ncbi:PilZ domain-containing protein [Hyalangium rubrum]|uniref:PilZ domain-containing protein n=1 Tax=Hyalangium rubrum TaxID=3103134 RepID=A0ABU5HAZ7_9BACT|nr:PilZ domain-containing protein [Hyalangium sp. s54d21]MDY7230643.1 PilZ domain-containing protein [Hyalangium sp. s54d21]
MSEHERRRHQRYTLQLTIRLVRGGQELTADIVNASASGCLLQVAVPLEPGEVLSGSIPEMMIPEAKLRVLRCLSGATGYMVATCFETLAAHEPAIARMSDDLREADPKGGWLN